MHDTFSRTAVCSTLGFGGSPRRKSMLEGDGACTTRGSRYEHSPALLASKPVMVEGDAKRGSSDSTHLAVAPGMLFQAAIMRAQMMAFARFHRVMPNAIGSIAQLPSFDLIAPVTKRSRTSVAGPENPEHADLAPTASPHEHACSQILPRPRKTVYCQTKPPPEALLVLLLSGWPEEPDRKVHERQSHHQTCMSRAVSPKIGGFLCWIWRVRSSQRLPRTAISEIWNP